MSRDVGLILAAFIERRSVSYKGLLLHFKCGYSVDQIDEGLAFMREEGWVIDRPNGDLEMTPKGSLDLHVSKAE